MERGAGWSSGCYVAWIASAWLFFGAGSFAGAEITCRSCFQSSLSPTSFRVKLLQLPSPLEVPRGVKLGPSDGEDREIQQENPRGGWGAAGEEEKGEAVEEEGEAMGAPRKDRDPPRAEGSAPATPDGAADGPPKETERARRSPDPGGSDQLGSRAKGSGGSLDSAWAEVQQMPGGAEEEGASLGETPGGSPRARRSSEDWQPFGPDRRGAEGGGWDAASPDGQRARTHGRGSKEEGRLGKLRGGGGEELKLSSTTFALNGDSAHNQAMVHWSGYNSSVILILTKLHDFNLGSVTESSLWRSTDYGTTYEKLNDKVGVKTVLSYLYVSPTNKRKIMLLSDPEIESSVLISNDEGATYQKYRLSFYIQSLLFHPKQEDWILAYSIDQKTSEFQCLK